MLEVRDAWDPESLDLGRGWAGYVIGSSYVGISLFTIITLGVTFAFRFRARRRQNLETHTSAFTPGDVLSLN
jgi:hypothetical protein